MLPAGQRASGKLSQPVHEDTAHAQGGALAGLGVAKASRKC
jgi:hypothetical protein